MAYPSDPVESRGATPPDERPDTIELAGMAIRRHVELRRKAADLKGRTIEDATVTDLGVLLCLSARPGVDGGTVLLWRA